MLDLKHKTQLNIMTQFYYFWIAAYSLCQCKSKKILGETYKPIIHKKIQQSTSHSNINSTTYVSSNNI